MIGHGIEISLSIHTTLITIHRMDIDLQVTQTLLMTFSNEAQIKMLSMCHKEKMKMSPE